MNKTDLKEIKKGSEGTGLLIENDGYISMSEGNNKQIKESVDNGSGWNCPNPFIVEAVFQKFGIKNANGRIYPENILKREVEKYQERINEKRALGECYKPDALILTEEGWKTLEDVKVGENILTLNTETNQIEIQPIDEKIEYDYSGDLIHIYNRNIDDIVTPKHEYILYNNYNDTYSENITAEDIFNKKYKKNKYIPKLDKNNKLKKCSNLDKRYLKTEKIHYEGKVMCVNVKNHNFYVMCNNKSHWTSNCNHPAESTIDLGRISHNIIELHWEGRTLIGKMELNLSQGYVKHGICSTLGDTVANLLLNGYKIGVSSRGVGSVEQKMGQYIVGDDFELICWDVVSDPSTPNAWIGYSKEELMPYVESVSKKNNKIINEKINKIKNILIN